MRRVRVDGLWLRPLGPEDQADLEVLSAEAFRDWARRPSRTVVAMASMAEHAVVAVLDGPLVGFALARRVDGPAVFGPWESPHVQHVDAIAVSPVVRRRGVGTALLGHLVELAERDGAKGVFAMTAAANRQARALFETLDFDYLAGLRGAYTEREPAVLFVKYLPPMLRSG